MVPFRGMVFAALLSGLIAGLLVTVVQQFGTVPLILEAEVFEQAAAAAEAVSEHHGEDEAWAPQDGLQRNGLTAITNILTATGFALLLVAAYAFRGRPIGWREGLLWGLAGFAAFTLAPGLGLPPELPGMAAAEVRPRQIWWIATVAATAAALGLLAFRSSSGAALAAIALIVVPHLVGAPQPVEPSTSVPETLAREFVVAVTVTSFLSWVSLGALTGFFYEKLVLGRHPTLVRASS
jgi:cobalt transporter subunit CbtA